MIITCDADICYGARNLLVCVLCLASCYLLFLVLLYCWFLWHFSLLFWQDFEEQPTHGTHPFHIVPDSKSQDLVSFLGPFSIRDSFTSFVIAGHIWWFLFRLFHLLFCALARTPKEFPFLYFLCHLLCCLGNEMFVCPFVIGIWHRTSLPATSPGSSTGMKYCNTCKSSTSFCFAHCRRCFQVITFLLSWSSEAWGVTHWPELCHLICANWLACGTCKFTALLHCMSWCISCSLIWLTLVAFKAG